MRVSKDDHGLFITWGCLRHGRPCVTIYGFSGPDRRADMNGCGPLCRRRICERRMLTLHEDEQHLEPRRSASLRSLAPGRIGTLVQRPAKPGLS